MKKVSVIILCVLLAVSILFTLGYSDTEKEKAAIKEASMNYIEGWYEGNADRMDKALHPDLNKVGVIAGRGDGKIRLIKVTKDQMVGWTGQGVGKKPAGERNIKVEILDIYKNTANVKITSVSFIDYVLLGKIDSEWKIINVLWEPVAQ